MRVPTPAFAEQLPAEAQTIRFTLRQVVLPGNPALPKQELHALWAGRLDTAATLADLFAIASAIGSRYRQAV